MLNLTNYPNLKKKVSNCVARSESFHIEGALAPRKCRKRELHDLQSKKTFHAGLKSNSSSIFPFIFLLARNSKRGVRVYKLIEAICNHLGEQFVSVVLGLKYILNCLTIHVDRILR